jgi:hypothetical protein
LIILALWGREIGQFRNGTTASILLIILASIPFLIGLPPIGELSESLLKTQVPRVADFSFLTGTIELQVLLGNKFNWDFDDLRKTGVIILWLLVILVPLLIQIVSYLY